MERATGVLDGGVTIDEAIDSLEAVASSGCVMFGDDESGAVILLAVGAAATLLRPRLEEAMRAAEQELKHKARGDGFGLWPCAPTPAGSPS